MLKLFLLWISCFQVARAFKVTGVRRMQEAEAVVAIADRALHRSMISPGIHKGITNASLLADAARSGGLLWGESDAKKHIERVMAKLDLDLSDESAAMWTAGGAVASMKGWSGKVATYGCKDKENGCTEEEEDGAEVVASSVTATFDLVLKVIQGEATWEDALNTAGGIIGTALTLANPILGQVFTVAFAVFSGILGMNQESAEVKLYKRIMKEVKLMIETQAIQTEIGARNTDMKVVVDEMAWAPTMLSNVKNDENKHVLLMYHMMIQHDIAKIAEKILSSNFGKDESSQPKEIWQVRASWSEAMVPIAFQMMMMQVNLIMEIQRHAGDEGRRAAEDRLNVVLASYKRFFGQHYPKVQAKKKSDMEAALAWNGYTYEKSRRRPTPRTCGYVAHGKSCTFEDENACATMACIWRSARYPCTDPNIKHSICTSSNLQSFWQTHQLPKIQKQRNLAQVLYDRKLMEGVHFKKMGSGSCKPASSRYRADARDFQTCAKLCQFDAKCYFFNLNQLTPLFSTSRNACSMYTLAAATCLGTYAKINPSFTLLGSGNCRAGHYDSKTQLALEGCRKACDEDDRCRFFSHQANNCRRYDSRAGTCISRGGTDQAYVSYAKVGPQVWRCHGAQGVEIGEKYIQFGNWRWATMDAEHFSIAHSGGQTSMIWRRYSQTLHVGPRTDWGAWGRAVGTALTSLDMDTSQQAVAFGNRFVQIGNWRFGDIDGQHFSISAKHQGQVKVVQSLNHDGSVTTDKTNPALRGEYWSRTVGIPKGIGVGNGFMQIGNFRIGEVDPDTFAVSHVSGKNPAVFYSSGRHCTTNCALPQGAESLFWRPVCIDNDS